MTVVTLERSCCVCDYHVYCSIRYSTTGKVLLCDCERTDEQDGYAIAIIKDGTVIGQLLQCIYPLFL